VVVAGAVVAMGFGWGAGLVVISVLFCD